MRFFLLPLSSPQRSWVFGIALALMAVLAVELTLSIRQESQTSDEAAFLFAGYRYWHSRDFGINPGHPPLGKWIAALPLRFSSANNPPLPAGLDEFRAGRIFLYANDADALLIRARLAESLFAFLLAFLVFAAAREMFGNGVALIALGLTVFEPNLLAHGGLATNDLAITCCLFAAVYTFYRYIQAPSAWRLAVCGLACGFTLGAKHSGLIIFPILGLLAVLELPARSFRGPTQADADPPKSTRLSKRITQMAGALLVIVAIAVAVLWGLYSFRYRARPSGLELSPPLPEYARGVNNPVEARAIASLARLRLLPESYLYGLAFVAQTEDRPTYLFGRLYAHGRWFYFPAAFIIKSTLGFLLLLVLAPLVSLSRKRDGPRVFSYQAIPAGFYFIFALTSHLNIGLRHLLPAYPFLILIAASTAWGLASKGRQWTFVICALLFAHAASSLWSFPNYLAYSNEAWGGPTKTYRWLTDSNVDWGQGLKQARRYLTERGVTDCWFAYFGTVDPAYYQIPCHLFPASSAVIWGRDLEVVPPVIEGTVLVSATELSGQAWGPGELNPYAPFQQVQPVDNIGGSILVFRGPFETPRLSALSRLWRVRALSDQGRLPEALAEAREAVALAPSCVDTQYVLGRVLKVAGQAGEARQAFEIALHLARTVYPEHQTYWLPILEAELQKP